ncbi:MAG: MFS transporter, partial [Geminicoccales bacterium]
LQMMLDRGEQLDWFGSREIWIELAIMLTGFWVFGVHTVTDRMPFIDPQIFRDRNFVAGLVFIFLIGTILLASMALLPPMLQNLMGYPTVTTGLVLAPRGVGTVISMILVGRLVRKVDTRILIFFGLLLTALSLWQMTGFTIAMDRWPIVWSGVVQGLGLGLVFVPLSTLAFATLDPRFRTDATSLFSLVRNLGSSLGISVVVTLLAQYTQLNHAELSERVTPFELPLYGQTLDAMSRTGAALFASIDAEVNRQAAMIAYLNDFKLMMLVTLGAIPLLLLLRAPRRVPAIKAAVD